MSRDATYSECYQALRYNGLDIVGSVFFAFVLYMRQTQIVEE